MKRLLSKLFYLPVLVLPLLLNVQPVFATDSAISCAAGFSHTLVVKSDQTVWATGDNSSGQLGDGTLQQRNVLVRVADFEGVIQVSAGNAHSLALKGDGTVWTWGLNQVGQLGNGNNTSSSSPVQVKNLNNVIAISSGGLHSIALKNDGTVWAWGSNMWNQLGNGQINGANSNIPVQVGILTDIIAIASGNNHNLAVKKDGTVWAWGQNDDDQLGDILIFSNGNGNPDKNNSLSNIVSVSAGNNFSLALDSNGKVYSWGDNSNGELGNGSDSSSKTPVLVSGLTDIVEIASGPRASHSLALKKDGTVYSWGKNVSGQLGNGSTVDSDIPVMITSTKE